MKKTYLSIIAATALSALLAFNAGAQTCSFLNLPTDARSAGMAGNTVSMSASALNPAASLFSADRASFGASYMMWQPKYADMKTLNVGGYFNVNSKLAFSAGYIDAIHSQQTLYDDNGSSKGTFTPSESSFRLGVAYKITDFLALAVTGKMAISDIGTGTEGKAFAGDASVIFRKDGLTAAAGVDNIGSKMSYGTTNYSLPMRIKGGAGYDFTADVHHISANAEAGYIPAQVSGGKSDFYAGAGLEYCYDNIVSARAGYHFDALKASFISVGVGVRFFGVGLDGFYLISGGNSPVGGSAGLALSYSF
jgi:hypothetical protein